MRLDSCLTDCQAHDVSARSPSGDAATEVILATFRANGLLLAAGERLASGEGLTASRWQVLGALALTGRPLTVPQIARRMGLARQSVHATVRRLASDGLVELVANADHRRSQLVRLTDLGDARYRAMARRQARWVDRLASGLDQAELETTARALGALCTKLEGDDDGR
jgi:DNA-binding MarR family transcriptional regulator